ncbi:AAA family ATPase [Methylosinus sp. PW1]|uniref:AAA family ATPase n=1 Tax=Methylosinus sp. PW1 TaxID=107636 RepID=UPI00069011A7|nr:AAA family ATPase [Methylosinus sp. PW1]
MSKLSHLRDDLFDRPDDDDDVPAPSGVADALAGACLGAALPADLRRRIRRGDTVAVVVQVPGADWCDPIARALRKDPHQLVCLPRDGSSRRDHDPAHGNDGVAADLAGGRSVVGVSQDPQRFLPSALLSAADARVTVMAPGAAILRRLMRKFARGKADVPDDIALGLSFAEIVCAFRPGAAARDVVANLMRAADAKKAATVSAIGDADDIPPIDCLPADLRRLAQDIASGVADYRAGRIRWRDVRTPGVLLAGPPGAGKTTFAASLARAMDVPLIVDSCGRMFARGGDAGHLGTIARAMQDICDAARSAAVAAGACVLCIDEFEAACPDRASMDRRGRDFWTPIVTLVLTLLEDHAGVIVVAASNFADAVDAAAVRPGRLTRIDVAPPGADTLARILHWRLGDALSGVSDADLVATIRLAGPGATPAHAAHWARDVLHAARAARRDAGLDDLLRVVAPPDHRSPADRRVAAVHEAGHCVAYLDAGLTIASTSIVARGDAGGETRAAGRRPEFPTRADLDAGVALLLAGRAAEEVVLGAASTGAVVDLAMATRALADGHGAHGLGDTLRHRPDPAGSLAFDHGLRAAVEADLARLHARAKDLMRQRRADVERIADALLDRRFLTGDDVAALLATPPVRSGGPKDGAKNAKPGPKVRGPNIRGRNS